jgi:hypothetical protein
MQPHHEPVGPPEIVVETTTVDTGERRSAFGYSARRIVTTRRQIHTGHSGATGETSTDGWYIDLERRPTCERDERGARAVLIASAGARNSARRVAFQDVGKPEDGFAIETIVTWRSADERGNGALSSTRHLLVTEVSSQALTPSLFDVPAGLRSSDGIFTRLAGRYVRTAQIVQSAVASWFR